MQSGAVQNIIRSGFLLYCSTLVNNLAGLIYWLLISSIGGSEVLGITSAIIGLASIINALLNLGVPVGVQRFLGKFAGMGDKERILEYFYTTSLFALVTYLLTGAVLLLLGYAKWNLGHISPEMLYMTGLAVVSCFVVVLNSLFMSLLRTDIIFLSTVLGNLVKLGIGTLLVSYGLGWVGATIGYIGANFLSLIIYLYFTLRSIGFKLVFSLSALADVIKAGIVSWLPSIIILAGQWLGVVVVFTTSTAAETGRYYIAFTLANIVLMISTSIINLLIPALSGMYNGRKRVANIVLEVGLILMTPVVILMSIYSWLPLSILGREYVEASLILTILLISNIPTAITLCVYNLVYAYGLYRQALLIGLTQNVPRILLYYMLAPVYGGLGVAIAYAVGALAGFLCSLHVARSVNFSINFRRIGVIITIPSIFGIISWSLGLHWLLGSLLILLSYIIYVKTGTLSRDTLKELLLAVIPSSVASKVCGKFKRILSLILH